jgi:hypothetical protein
MVAKLKRRLRDHERANPGDASFAGRLMALTDEIERRFDGDERSRLLLLAEETFDRHLTLRDHTRRAHASLDQLRADQQRLMQLLEMLRARPECETLH